MRAYFTASFSSASAQTMKGDFPPSSSYNRFILFIEQFCITCLPTSVEPVKEILSTRVCFTSSFPVSPSPVIMLITPFGKSVFWINEPRYKALREVYSAGFIITVFPQALKKIKVFTLNKEKCCISISLLFTNAGDIFQQSIIIG